MKVGDKVTRNRSSIVWEIAEMGTAEQVFGHALVVRSYGGPDAVVVRLKNTTTGKINRNVWWNVEDLTAI